MLANSGQLHATVATQKAQMRGNHAPVPITDSQISHQRSARLQARQMQRVDVLGQNIFANQQSITMPPNRPVKLPRIHNTIRRLRFDHPFRQRSRATPKPVIRLLQSHHVNPETSQNPRNPSRIATPVRADAFVNIPTRNFQVRHENSRKLGVWIIN